MFKRIMWATDRSPTTERVLPLATELAKSNGAKLIVTHVEKITTIAGKPVFNDSTASLDADLHTMVDGLMKPASTPSCWTPKRTGAAPPTGSSSWPTTPTPI